MGREYAELVTTCGVSGGVESPLSVFRQSGHQPIYIYGSVVKNKPTRKAEAENVGTFMPTCCFSLICISIYIYIYREREIEREGITKS